MNVEIICPLYNAETYLTDLHQSLLKQENVDILNIHYVLTRSVDQSENILRNLNHCTFHIIEKKDFSHSLTRENAAFASKADILTFITQDIKIYRTDWLYNLIQPIMANECAAAYSRQICDDPKSIEKYIREVNYPAESKIKSKKDISKSGLNTFFFSDVSSAIKREVFIQMNGYDHKDFKFNEDMYFAYKLITNGYQIKYCADSEVVHYHNLPLKEIYKRYHDSGTFFKENPYFNEYGKSSSGFQLAKQVLKKAVQDGNIKVILEWLPNMTARYLGMKSAE